MTEVMGGRVDVRAAGKGKAALLGAASCFSQKQVPFGKLRAGSPLRRIAGKPAISASVGMTN